MIFRLSLSCHVLVHESPILLADTTPILGSSICEIASQWNSSSVKRSLVHFCIISFAMMCAFSPVFLYTMFPLARKFYKEQSFFFNVKSSLRGSKSLKHQEISPHLIKSSFTPNKFATVSNSETVSDLLGKHLFWWCQMKYHTQDFFQAHILGSLSHVMKIKALSAHRFSEYLTICTCLHLYTQRHIYTGYISTPWRKWAKSNLSFFLFSFAFLFYFLFTLPFFSIFLAIFPTTNL